MAKIDHYCQEIHGNHIPFKLPMGLSASQATYLEHCQRLLRSSSSERSQRSPPCDWNNFASTSQMYASPRRRRCQHVPRRSAGGDSDPSNSDWESASVVSETSTVSRRQKGEGTYDPKMDRKIFLPKLTDDSTEEACWMWRADALALIEKGSDEQAIEVEMRKSLASCSKGLWFLEKCLLGYSLLQILNEMER